MARKQRIASLYASEALRKQYLTEIAAEPVRRIRHLTHIEIFPSNPLETARTGKTVKQETILLFRYDKRNPLDASAFIYQIT